MSREKPEPMCPACNARLHNNQMFPDMIAQREIGELLIHCPNKDCPATMELNQKNKHMESCEYGLLPCPNHCAAILRRRSLQHHLTNDCVRRTFSCVHCGKEVPIDQKESHLTLCTTPSAQCQFCGHHFMQRDLDEHIKSSCLHAPIQCHYRRFGCNAQVERCKIDDHYTSEVHNHLHIVSQCVNSLSYSTQQSATEDPMSTSTITRSDTGTAGSFLPQQHSLDSTESPFVTISDQGFSDVEMYSGLPSVGQFHQRFSETKVIGSTHYPVQRTSSQYLSSLFPSQPFSDPLSTRTKWPPGQVLPPGEFGQQLSRPPGGQDAILAYKEKLQEAEHNVKRLEATVQSQAARLMKYERIVTDLRGAVQDFEGRCCNGTYYWKIKDYRRKRQDAINGTVSALHSPGFYSGFHGYKMCIRVNLNGVETAFGTHISVFLHFMRGEDDDVKKWPFSGKITITILDQSESDEPQNIVETLFSKPDLAAFQRPMSNRNHKGFGYLEFAPLSHIEHGSFIRNDTLIIKAVIDEAE